MTYISGLAKFRVNHLFSLNGKYGAGNSFNAQNGVLDERDTVRLPRSLSRDISFFFRNTENEYRFKVRFYLDKKFGDGSLLTSIHRMPIVNGQVDDKKSLCLTEYGQRTSFNDETTDWQEGISYKNDINCGKYFTEGSISKVMLMAATKYPGFLAGMGVFISLVSSADPVIEEPVKIKFLDFLVELNRVSNIPDHDERFESYMELLHQIRPYEGPFEGEEERMYQIFDETFRRTDPEDDGGLLSYFSQSIQ